jgi:hypothetical protein
MKYTVLKACGISGTFYEIGDVVELEKHEAAALLASNQVTKNSDTPKPVNKSVKKTTVKKRKK